MLKQGRFDVLGICLLTLNETTLFRRRFDAESALKQHRFDGVFMSNQLCDVVCLLIVTAPPLKHRCFNFECLSGSERHFYNVFIISVGLPELGKYGLC